MKPILYRHDETVFDTNGIGVLTDTVSCKVKNQINGPYEIVLQYPDTGIHFEQIHKREILLCKADPVSELQPFRIYRITKPSSHMVTIYARHVAYDLDGIPVLPFEADGVINALRELKARAAVLCPFDFSTDKATIAKFVVAEPAKIWRLLGGTEGSVLDVYAGEYEFDRWRVILHNRRGTDRGVSIRYGKNLTSLEQDTNCGSVFTGVLPFWKDVEKDTVTTLPENVVAAEGTYNFVRIMPLDLTDEFETEPEPEKLREAARSYMRRNKIGVPKISWRVEFVQLEQTEEYKGKALLERVLIGDTVHVDFPQMAVSASARAVEYVYDALLEKYESVTLGSIRSSMVSTIVEQQKEIHKKPSMSDMQSAVGQLTGSIVGAKGGSVRLLDTNGDGKPDTLYIADDPDPEKAVKVWRFNHAGWGASKTGYNGPYAMGATFEDGLIADFITAGSLSANLIKSGVLVSNNGRFVLNLDTGEISISGYATSQETNALKDKINQQGSSLSTVSGTVQNIVDNGVDKVTTKTGYTFNEDGLRIRKSGEEMENRLDNTGMYVERSGEIMLQANNKGVVATDVTVRNYLIVGTHSRFEDYEGGTGCFFLGGETLGNTK